MVVFNGRWFLCNLGFVNFSGRFHFFSVGWSSKYKIFGGLNFGCMQDFFIIFTRRFASFWDVNVSSLGLVRKLMDATHVACTHGEWCDAVSIQSVILLMEEIPNNHLECINLVNTGRNYISTGAGFLPSTVSVPWSMGCRWLPGGYRICTWANYSDLSVE